MAILSVLGEKLQYAGAVASNNSNIKKNNFHICGCVSSIQKELGLQLKSVP